jgi:hypothetical protein
LTTTSTVPANGDVNPYGVAFVPRGFPGGGTLQPGDVLVSNFNNSMNLQGTGTTIVENAPNGSSSVFYQGPSGLGLTTALGVLKEGFVIVGNVPTTDGTSATIQPGSLIILDRSGHVVANLTSTKLLDGPWDLAVNDRGNNPQLFVSNVLSGTVTRIDLKITHHGQKIQVMGETQIASGYAHRSDPAALEVGPTGLAFDPRKNVLYVASTEDNAIYAVTNASTTHSDHGTGRVIYQDNTHLRGPLGLAQAPDGDLIAANGDAIHPDPQGRQTSELVEFTPKGRFVGQFSIAPGQPGGAFGVALGGSGHNLILAAVNDITNALEEFQVHG